MCVKAVNGEQSARVDPVLTNPTRSLVTPIGTDSRPNVDDRAHHRDTHAFVRVTPFWRNPNTLLHYSNSRCKPGYPVFSGGRIAVSSLVRSILANRFPQNQWSSSRTATRPPPRIATRRNLATQKRSSTPNIRHGAFQVCNNCERFNFVVVASIQQSNRRQEKRAPYTIKTAKTAS